MGSVTSHSWVKSPWTRVIRRESVHRVVVGRVVGIHISDDVLGDDGKIDVLAIRPLARLGYLDYTSVVEVFTMEPQATAAGMIGEAVAAPEKASV